MKYLNYDIVLSDCPDEISLAFNLTGCPLKCNGCHSPELRNTHMGKDLQENDIKLILDTYGSYITCVIFFGGDWNKPWIISSLNFIKTKYSLKTCLYSGYKKVDKDILSMLDYVKLGPYIESKGALDNPNTNQKFIRLNDNVVLNKLFQSGNYSEFKAKKIGSYNI